MEQHGNMPKKLVTCAVVRTFVHDRRKPLTYAIKGVVRIIFHLFIWVRIRATCVRAQGSPEQFLLHVIGVEPEHGWDKKL